MRDPKRIDRILDTIKTVWKEYPDIRLGQILSNTVVRANVDLFYIEDDELEDLLAKFYSKEKCDDTKKDNDTFVTGLDTSETSTYHNNYDLPSSVSTSTSYVGTTTTANEVEVLCLNIAKCKVMYYDEFTDTLVSECSLISGKSMEDITEKLYYYYDDYDIVKVNVAFLHEDEENPIYIEEELFDVL